MSASAALSSGAAGRYASALFELSRDGNFLESVEADLQNLSGLLDESAELRAFVQSPAYGRSDQASAMTALLEKMGAGPITSNFVKLMVSKGRLHALPDAVAGFGALLAQHRGEETAEVTTATALTDAQRDALASKLHAAHGKDIKIEESVDPSLLGGLIVRIGSKMIDASLKAKLASLKLAMKEA